MPSTDSSSQTVMATLRRLVRPRPQPTEQCELCGAGLPHEHEHLLDVQARRLLCACHACGVLFSDQQSGRYRRVWRHAERLPDFQLTDMQWESLLIPINLAFFFYSTPGGRVVAMYPSPAGATESLLEFSTWQELAVANPVLNHLQPDVEALLVNRIGQAKEYYRISIDRCYELIGLIRMHWRGLSGGNVVWEKIQEFFQGLKASAQKEEIHA